MFYRPRTERSCIPRFEEEVRHPVKLQRRNQPLKGSLLALSSALLLVACGGSGQTDGGAGGRGGRGGPGGPTQVGYVVVQQGNAPIEQQLPGRVSAYQVSEVRPQVSGVVLRRLFREGSVVRQGQTLYQIDPSIYQAAAAQAAANLRKRPRQRAGCPHPGGALQAACQDGGDRQAGLYRRGRPVAPGRGSGRQNNAALRSAQINVRYTRVPAPITGRISLSNVTEGALVTANQAEALTTITRLDPVYVDIQELAASSGSSPRADRGRRGRDICQVRLQLPDGSSYGFTGTVEFSQVIVDQTTGTVTLRARFPNPQGILLPGMFVTAQFAQAIDTSAFLVPQAGVSRDPKGNATVWVVGSGNRAVQRVVVANRTQGQYWVVTQGLAPGEKVITQGTANLRDGARSSRCPLRHPSGSRRRRRMF